MAGSFVTLDAISKVLLDPSSIVRNIILQVLQLDSNEDGFVGFVSDGSEKLDVTIIRNQQEPVNIENLDLIRILDYSIVDQQNNQKLMIVKNYERLRSDHREIEFLKRSFIRKKFKKPDTGNASNVAAEPTVGLVYDSRMVNHTDPDGFNNCEMPERITAIWDKLQNNNLTSRCLRLPSKEAEDGDLLLVHGQAYLKKINSLKLRTHALDSVFFNGKGSRDAAYLAAGCTLEAVKSVVSKLCNSAVAIVRPPGHHALQNTAKGFCIFNNVAVAASHVLQNPHYGTKKILVVDWDIHHGNGTQDTFWNDSRVLFFSIHRYDKGKFYPESTKGSCHMIGGPLASGYNINVAFDNSTEKRKDEDYFAVWDNILLPVAEEFKPDLIIVSAGFDAALGDNLGSYRVSPSGYAIMLQKLLHLANGRIVLALEGGYNVEATSNCLEACLKVLLGNRPTQSPTTQLPFESTWVLIDKVRHLLNPYWSSLKEELRIPQPKIAAGNNSALIPDTWVGVKLESSEIVNKDTNIYRFSLDPNKKLGLHVASCIQIRAPSGAKKNNKFVIRPYTPISDMESKGFFDLLIKVYPKGKMSRYFTSLKPGDMVDVQGPIEKFRYTPNMKQNIGMIAGGSGITPMFQIIQAILKNSTDTTQISLIYENVFPDDLLLRQELDSLAKRHPNFKVFYTVVNPTITWKGGAGYVSKDMVVKGLSPPSDRTLVLVCAPQSMMQRVSGEKTNDWEQGEVSGILKDAGYSKQMVYKF